MAEPPVTVELFGLARHRAGCPELTVVGGTIAELLRAVGRARPGLGELISADGTISEKYLVSIDGERFVTNAAQAIPVGSRLLILGADAGG